MREEVKERVRKCLIDLDRECVLNSVRSAVGLGVKATDLVLGPMSEAMKEIGDLYEEGEYFIAELIEAADIFKEAMRFLDPYLRKEALEGSSKGVPKVKVAIGTIKGDVHDIGKSLVAVMLQAAGHEVLDLGINVGPEKFIKAVKDWGAEVIGMSALLTTTARNMGDVIEALVREGLRDKVYVIVGGAATSEEFAMKIGADKWCRNAVEAVKVVNEFAARRKA